MVAAPSGAHSPYPLQLHPFSPMSDAFRSALESDALYIEGPCLSVASWSALPPASVPSNMAGLGVNGYVYFCQTKSRSAAEPKPGNTNNRLDIIVVETQDGFPIKNVGNDRVGESLFVVRSVVGSLEKGGAPLECQKERLDKPLKYYFREPT